MNVYRVHPPQVKMLFPVVFPLPEFIDPVFAKASQNARFLLSENERFGLVFVKTGSINSGSSFGLVFAKTGSIKSGNTVANNQFPDNNK
jgi:hypothetical protein